MSDRDVIERNRIIAEKSAEIERLRGLLRDAIPDATKVCPDTWRAARDAVLGAASQPRPLTSDERAALDRAFERSITVIHPGIDATGDQPAAALDDEADKLLAALGLNPERFRTEAGFLNVPKVVAALRNPRDYKGLYLPEGFAPRPLATADNGQAAK